MDWKHASMCADVSNGVYNDHDECYNQIGVYVKDKKSFKFFDEDGAQGCMFRHDKDKVVIAFRGTEPTKLNDLLADLKAWKDTSETKGRVHAGFKAEADKLWPLLYRLIIGRSVNKERDTILITGHSLGAAIATIIATRASAEGYRVNLYTYGSPRVGNSTWAEQFEDGSIPTWRFVNNNDIVTKVPPFGLFFTHIGDLKYINYYGNVRVSTWWQRLKDQMRGRFRALCKFQLFDGAFDHSMGLYADKVRKNRDQQV